MSFSATWGDQDKDVYAVDALDDLSLRNATLSPPLDQLADDVRTVIEDIASEAAILIDTMDKNFGKAYVVKANGHVRQGDNDSGFVTINIAEKVVVPSASATA